MKIILGKHKQVSKTTGGSGCSKEVKNKKINKTKLQQELGLEVDSKKYMIGLISRLTDQKGLDLINYCIEIKVINFLKNICF